MHERFDERLWHGALPPDLERVRAAVRWLPLPPEPDWTAGPARSRPRFAAVQPHVVLALAAAFVAVFAAAWLWSDAWRVRPIVGRPSLSGAAFAGRVARGGSLTTDAGTRARLEVSGVGAVTLDRGGCVRRDLDGRMRLERGTLVANVGGAPRRLVIETRMGKVVALGGACALTVRDRESGRLQVARGRAVFAGGGTQSYLPAGVWCPLTRAGAGVPRRADASGPFLAAIAVTDNPACQADDFRPLLEKAEARDAITLWHLLPRVRGTVRRQVAERFAALVEVPRDVPLDRVLALEPRALEAWWNALGLGALDQWRDPAR